MGNKPSSLSEKGHGVEPMTKSKSRREVTVGVPSTTTPPAKAFQARPWSSSGAIHPEPVAATSALPTEAELSELQQQPNHATIKSVFSNSYLDSPSARRKGSVAFSIDTRDIDVSQPPSPQLRTARTAPLPGLYCGATDTMDSLNTAPLSDKGQRGSQKGILKKRTIGFKVSLADVEAEEQMEAERLEAEHKEKILRKEKLQVSMIKADRNFNMNNHKPHPIDGLLKSRSCQWGPSVGDSPVHKGRTCSLSGSPVNKVHINDLSASPVNKGRTCSLSGSPVNKGHTWSLPGSPRSEVPDWAPCSSGPSGVSEGYESMAMRGYTFSDPCLNNQLSGCRPYEDIGSRASGHDYNMASGLSGLQSRGPSSPYKTSRFGNMPGPTAANGASSANPRFFINMELGGGQGINNACDDNQEAMILKSLGLSSKSVNGLQSWLEDQSVQTGSRELSPGPIMDEVEKSAGSTATDIYREDSQTSLAPPVMLTEDKPKTSIQAMTYQPPSNWGVLPFTGPSQMTFCSQMDGRPYQNPIFISNTIQAPAMMAQGQFMQQQQIMQMKGCQPNLPYEGSGRIRMRMTEPGKPVSNMTIKAPQDPPQRLRLRGFHHALEREH